MPAAEANCPRCRTKLPEGPGAGTRCPVCGFDLSGQGARWRSSFAETLLSALPSGALGRCVIDGVLSSGPRRAVLRAHFADRPGQPVVLKAVAHDRTSPSAQGRLVEAARRAVNVRHEALATLLEVGMDRALGLACFLSEFAPGSDLARHLAESGTMEPADVAVLGASIARALDVLHAAGAFHMDVKPAHVVMEEDAGPAAVRLVETGFAPVLLTSSGHGETAHEPIVGTPTYVAPEQARDATAASPASDLYSLGATMFHLLTGRPPFVGDTPVGILVQHATRAAPPVKSLAPAVPDELACLVDALLAKDPSARPSAQEVTVALSELAEAPEGEPGLEAARVPPAPAVAPPVEKEPEGPRPLSRAWLAREAMVAEILVERGKVTFGEIVRALAPVDYSPEAGRGLAEIILDLGILRREDLDDCENELAAREKRRWDAAFGRLAIELGYLSREDLDRVLAETGDPWASLSDTLVRTGTITRDRARTVEASCVRYLCELDSAAHQRTARKRGLPAEAVTAARSAVGELQPGDDRSLFEIMMEQGALTPVAAWALAAAHVKRSVEAKG